MKNPQPAMPALNVSPEKVFFILVKAREFDAKVPRGDGKSGSNPADDGEREILEDVDDGTAEELRAAIDQLTVDEQIDLVALAWVGRGDFDGSAFQEARALAAERRQRRTSRYLMGMPMLGDYLEEGLGELGYSCEEYELNRL